MKFDILIKMMQDVGSFLKKELGFPLLIVLNHFKSHFSYINTNINLIQRWFILITLKDIPNDIDLESLLNGKGPVSLNILTIADQRLVSS